MDEKRIVRMFLTGQTNNPVRHAQTNHCMRRNTSPTINVLCSANDRP